MPYDSKKLGRRKCALPSGCLAPCEVSSPHYPATLSACPLPVALCVLAGVIKTPEDPVRSDKIEEIQDRSKSLRPLGFSGRMRFGRAATLVEKSTKEIQFGRTRSDRRKDSFVDFSTNTAALPEPRSA